MLNWKLILISIALLLFAGCSNGTYTFDKVDVAIQDQTTEVIDLFLTRHIDDFTLNQAYNIDDWYINITILITPNISTLFSK